jgi:MoaA/NifB/PqqE/SkfB family radical SAM enzyme
MSPSAVPVSAPVTFVELELTSECHPSRCCHVCNATIRGAAGMGTGHWKQVIASAADAGVELIQFTGGKAALFPDLVEYALSAGVKVDVHSLLVHVSDGMWDLFALLEVSLGICWFAADPLQHAEVTGTEGSWYLARRNTANALDRGLVPRAEVVTLIDGPRISQACAELSRLGISVIHIDHARSAVLAAADQFPALEDPCAGCGDGRAGVTWYGAVVPCVVLARTLAAGNVKDTPFADIVNGPGWKGVLASIPRGQTRRMCVGADYIECAQRQS